MRLENFCEGFGGRDGYERMEVDRELGIKTVIYVEGRTIDRGLMYIIVREYCERQKICPIVLLIIAIDMEILFDSLVHTFSLSIGLGVECCR